MGINLANIQATRQAEAKDAELQRDVETKRAEMELEKRRAIDLVSARIAKESAQQKADAQYYNETRGADGRLYKEKQDVEAHFIRMNREAEVNLLVKTKEAEANLISKTKEAEANLISKSKEAEANLILKTKEAEALTEMAKAYGAMSDVLGGPQGLLQYLMLQSNTYEKLAKANATAINGLQPKITVWNTGEGASSDSTAPIRNLLQSLPPLLSTINDQTGIAPPSWLAQMSPGERSQALTVPEGKGKVNGYAHGMEKGSK